MNRLHLFYALLVIVLMSGCVDEGLQISESEIRPEPQEIISTSVHGKVLDKSGNPMSSASVTMKSVVGDLTTRTDEFGNFEFPRYPNIGESAFLRVEAPGYFDGFRRVSVLKDNFNYTQIRLFEREIVGTFSASTGGTVSTPDGLQVTLPAEGIMRQNGTAYTGNVQVAAAWVDPSSEDIPDLMIGDLSGRGLDGEIVTLFTYGMANIELLDDAGNELQVRDGVMAELSYPVPDARLASAPQTIPLWSYDEEQGTWIEESFARLEGNRYVGDVAHFSSWNVDVKTDPISISGCVMQQQGARQISARAQIFICSEQIGTKGGWLCPDGKFLFYNFPKDEIFTLKIKDECNGTVYEQEYGPFSEDTDLGDIDISLSDDINVLTITGQGLLCDGTFATNGYARLTSEGGAVYFADFGDDGQFLFEIVYCDVVPTFTLEVFEFDNFQMSEAVEVIPSGPENINVGAIDLCEDLEEFFHIDFPNYYSYTWFDPRYTPNDFITAVLPDTIDFHQLMMSFDDEDLPDGVGTYDVRFFFVTFFEPEIAFRCTFDALSSFPVELIQFGENPGDVIRGSASLPLDVTQTRPVDSTFITTATFQFRIIRD